MFFEIKQTNQPDKTPLKILSNPTKYNKTKKKPNKPNQQKKTHTKKKIKWFASKTNLIFISNGQC